MARARFLARRRRSRHCTAGASGSAAPRCNIRVMTRTASDNSVLSLGSCIRSEVTVLSSRTVAPLSIRSCLALANKAWLIASQVSARIAAIVCCSTDFFGDEQSATQHAFRRQSAPAGLAHSLSPQVTRDQAGQLALAVQPLRHRLKCAADLVLRKHFEYSGLDGAFLRMIGSGGEGRWDCSGMHPQLTRGIVQPQPQRPLIEMRFHIKTLKPEYMQQHLHRYSIVKITSPE